MLLWHIQLGSTSTQVQAQAHMDGVRLTWEH